MAGILILLPLFLSFFFFLHGQQLSLYLSLNPQLSLSLSQSSELPLMHMYVCWQGREEKKVKGRRERNEGLCVRDIKIGGSEKSEVVNPKRRNLK